MLSISACRQLVKRQAKVTWWLTPSASKTCIIFKFMVRILFEAKLGTTTYRASLYVGTSFSFFPEFSPDSLPSYNFTNLLPISPIGHPHLIAHLIQILFQIFNSLTRLVVIVRAEREDLTERLVPRWSHRNKEFWVFIQSSCVSLTKLNKYLTLTSHSPRLPTP